MNIPAFATFLIHKILGLKASMATLDSGSMYMLGLYIIVILCSSS